LEAYCKGGQGPHTPGCSATEVEVEEGVHIPSENFLVCQKYIPENYWQFDCEIILVY
jgi:hypothetical protein